MKFGKLGITIICAVVIWGISLICFTIGENIGAGILLVCSIFGWKALKGMKVTSVPGIFWILYFTFKVLLSAVIGFFVALFVLGRIIYNKISKSDSYSQFED